MADTQDFAKLFRVDGLGQVLVTLDEDDEGRPCIVYRASDAGGCIIKMTQSIPDSGDYEQDERAARRNFEFLNDDNIATRAGLLRSARSLALKSAGAA